MQEKLEKTISLITKDSKVQVAIICVYVITHFANTKIGYKMA